MGACLGNEESAGVNYSHRCPKGNRQMRRVLNQAANATVKAKGTIFNVVYRRLVPRLGHAQAIGAITHRLCRLIWKLLHERVRYEERGPAVSAAGACFNRGFVFARLHCIALPVLAALCGSIPTVTFRSSRC